MKKFCAVLAFFVIIATITTPQVFAAVSSENGITNLTLTAENCNIILEISPDGQFHYDYDAAVFDLSAVDTGSSVGISVNKKAGVGKVWPIKFITIKIPNLPYSQMDFTMNNVGVSIPAMNVDMNVNAKNSAVSVSIPVGFNKTLIYNSSEGSDSIKLQSEVTDIKFTLDATKSAVSTPDDWPCYNNEQPYLYQVGDAVGNINANIDGCAFTIKFTKSEKESGQLPSSSGTYSAANTSNSADATALDIMQRTGNWGYIETYFPTMSRQGIDAVVNCYNSKHPNPDEHKKASDYYN